MKWFGRRKNREEGTLPVLSTERLVLRGFDKNDAVHVYAYAQNDRLAAMTGFKPHAALEDSLRMVEDFIEKGEYWAIVEKSTGRVIGSIGLPLDSRRSEFSSARRISYVIGEAFWGNAYTTEACREVLRYGFDELNCDLISASHLTTNTKNKRTLKKLGFTPEGVMRRAKPLPGGEAGDLVIYSLLKAEYEEQQRKNSK